MKKLYTILATALVVLLGFNANAQVEKTGTVTITAKLNTVMSLDLTAGTEIEFNFNTIEQFRNGIGADGSLTTAGKVGSTANWTLSCAAVNLVHTEDESATIAANNVGVIAEYGGNNTAVSVLASETKALAAKVELLGYNTAANKTNAGTADENPFTLKWEMGTKRGNMYQTSIYDQNLKKGTYNTTVTLTAQEVL
ncbi:hypothetical protein EMN47_19980 [Prolixibacteraceae bacterium JC049]|nr:hypothetical protein [Prolixibacteraceae bacterium JC049]